MSQAQTLSDEQRLWRWRVLVATYCAYAGYYLVRKVFSVVKSTLAKPVAEGGYGMGFQAVANIWTVYLVAYMLGQFLNSYIGRKWGPRVLILGGLAASMACNVVFGFANSYYTFMVFMAFNGLVQAAGWPASVGSVAEWLRKEERGAIMGIWSSSYIVGNLVVKYLAGFLLATFGVELASNGVPYAFWGCTLATFAIWWLVYFWQRTRPQDVGLPAIIDVEHEEDQTVAVADQPNITFGEYLRLLFHPIIFLMGCSYFCIKFLRYMLDSWLPTFLNLQGLAVDKAAYYSTIFDIVGIAGAVLAGFAMDRIFKGRWERVCVLLAFGMVISYISVVQWGANPYMQAICFGLVGLMLYGPDTILCGAAAVVVAGERNAVAVAGIINGIGSIGPIVQEQVVGMFLSGNSSADAIRDTNLMGLGVSVVFFFLLAIITAMTWRGQHKHKDA